MKPLRQSLLFAAVLAFITCSDCSTVPTGTASATPVDASWQGWSDAETIAWYTTSQGSRLIPQTWLRALEQPDASKPFLDADYVASFRYLPSPAKNWIPPAGTCAIDPALPLGFAVDCQSDSALSDTKLRWKTGQSDREPWVGMNCSACHTAALTYNGKTVVIEGGPTLADFQSFTVALEKALELTESDPAKFDRFAAQVLGSGAAQSDRELLHDALKSRNAWNARLARLNATPIQYGYGRLDAIGHIFNKVGLVAMPDDAANQTANPADAPVSYPFLWNEAQQDRVEWDGLVTNTPVGHGPGHDFDAGALGRNAGEVIGVFADITIKPPSAFRGYPSSINVPNLVGMEEEIERLQPPKWPKDWPLDAALAQRGADVFIQQHCDSCHTIPTKPASLTERYTVKLVKFRSSNPADHPTNTDMWMACNAALDKAKTGAFKGTKLNFVSGTAFGDESYSGSLVQNAVSGALLAKKPELVATALEGVFGVDRGLPLPAPTVLARLTPRQARQLQCLTYPDDPKDPKLVYKARPLQGIWATALYLHNGSVTTLYQLLLPPVQRRASFYTGTRRFNAKEVGFESDQAPDNGFLFQTHDAAGQSIPGNSNEGHDYGNAALSDADRWALVEYMKTL